MYNFLIAMAQPPSGNQQVSPLAGFLPIIIIFAIFYFLLIRPQQRRQQQHQRMLQNLKKGDKVITTGGIHGVVVNIKDKVVTLKVAENVRIDISKSCIAGLKREEQDDKTA